MKKSIHIGITDCSKYENYHRWLEAEKGVTIIKLSHHDKNLDEIRKCDGVLLTGGEDVHPKFYNRNDYLDLCHEVDEQRDEFEWKVMEYTEKNKVPVLGICRGLQVGNVFFGGTLLPHIPVFGKFDHSKTGQADRYHMVQVDPNSQLRTIVGAASGEINSAHHQGADRIGQGLVASALSPDGIVEGLERQDKEGQAFLLLVQWHPERMKDLSSSFSKNLKEHFVNVCRQSESAKSS